jgi:hypothetical protein
MKEITVFLSLLFLSTLEISCANSALDSRSYLKFVENKENGLNKSQVIDRLQLTLQYKPKEYILLKERIVPGDSKIVHKRILELGDMQYYNFRISTDGTIKVLNYNCANDKQYFNRIAYLSGDVQSDFFLIQKGDTLPCLLYNFVRNYDVAPYLDFVLAFDGDINNYQGEDREFVYDDKIFGIGRVTFQLNHKDLINIPKLKY